MERALIEKIKKLEESEKQLVGFKILIFGNKLIQFIFESDERLQMLESKRRFEEMRIELDREKEKLRKTEQQSILNKDGAQRAPIRMRLGSGK